MGKVVSAHAVLLLEVADDGLDGGPPFELALDLRRDRRFLATRVDKDLLGRNPAAQRTAHDLYQFPLIRTRAPIGAVQWT